MFQKYIFLISYSDGTTETIDIIAEGTIEAESKLDKMLKETGKWNRVMTTTLK